MSIAKMLSLILTLSSSTSLFTSVANACTIISTNEIHTIENGAEQAGLDYALGTFWPNRNGSYDLGERVEFFRAGGGPRAQNLRFKVHGGTISEYPHAQRLYYQASSASAPVVIASRAILSPVAWRLVDGLDFEYETQKLPAVYPKYSLSVSVITTSRAMTQKLCQPKNADGSALLSSTFGATSTSKENRDRPQM